MVAAIIIQGPTIYYKQIISLYKNTSNVVWCTWNDEPLKAVEAIRQSTINLYLVDKPLHTGKGNINYQSKSTYDGIVKAKELFDADYYIKIRSDFDITNVNLLIERFCEINLPLNFLGWIDIYGGYILDYIVAGDYNKMLKFWAYDDIANIGEPFAEKYLMFRYYGLTDNNYNMVNVIRDNLLVFPSLNNISIYWIKRKMYIKLFGKQMRFNYNELYLLHRSYLALRSVFAKIIKKSK